MLPVGTYAVIEPAEQSSDSPSSEYSFLDGAAHRERGPSANMIYNTYRRAALDPCISAASEEAYLLFYSAFVTGWGIIDDLAHCDPPAHGADVLVVSSASAKTAFLTAFYWKQRFPDCKVIGLGRPSSKTFAESLGVYDSVLPYESIEQLQRERVVFVDFLGDPTVRYRVHKQHDVVSSLSIGGTAANQLLSARGITTCAVQAMRDFFTRPGANPKMWLIYDYLHQRATEIGASALDAQILLAWKSAVEAFSKFVQVVPITTWEGVSDTWVQLAQGKVDPRDGFICTPPVDIMGGSPSAGARKSSSD